MENRIIKFRVWVAPYMDYDVKVDSLGAYGEPDKKYDTPHIEVERYDEGAPIMQFIGEKDSTGKEAYESDIVIAEFERAGNMNGNHRNPYKTKCEIIFENGSFMLMNKQSHSKNSRNWHKRTFSHPELQGFLICGNVFESPELLK